MARTALTLYSFEHKPRRKDINGNFDEVGGSGVLRLFEHFCHNVHPDHLVDRRHAKYLKVKDNESKERFVSRHGRLVLAHVDSGIWGNAGSTYDVNTHQPTHDREDYESATITTRVGLLVPPGSPIGFICVEREGRQGDGVKLVNHFQDALRETWSDSWYMVDRVTYPEAWTEQADLTRVEVRNKKWKPSLGGEAEPETVPQVAELRRELRPLRGEKKFRNRFKRRLLAQELDMSEVIGIPEGEETETLVELVSEGRRKSFVLGDFRTPSMEIPLTSGDQARLSDQEICRAIFNEAREFYQRLSMSWDNTWEQVKGDEDDGVDWDHPIFDPASAAHDGEANLG